ncbi:MAG: hypothetical protein VB040_08955 [Propionibacterium sp.]|nr:hypothetical protein [Propionibacterium sp.]
MTSWTPVKRRHHPGTRIERAWAALLWAGVTLPELAISAVIWLVILALLPDIVAWAVLMVGAVLSVVLATGWARWAAIRVFFGGRRLTTEQADQLMLPLALAGTFCDVSGIELGVVRKGDVPVLIGPRVILLDPDTLADLEAGELDEIGFVLNLAHFAMLLRLGYSRFELLRDMWCLPVDVLHRIGEHLQPLLHRNPLIGALWWLRFIVGIAALVRCAMDGALSIGLIAAGIIAASYALPRIQHAWNVHLTAMARVSVLRAYDAATEGAQAVLGNAEPPDLRPPE